jgi:hypothetical protein
MTDPATGPRLNGRAQGSKSGAPLCSSVAPKKFSILCETKWDMLKWTHYPSLTSLDRLRGRSVTTGRISSPDLLIASFSVKTTRLAPYFTGALAVPQRHKLRMTQVSPTWASELAAVSSNGSKL